MIHLADARQALEAAGLIRGLPLDDMLARCATGQHLSDSGQRVLAFYLNEIDRGRLYQAHGYGTTALLAEVQLGLEARRTRELIAVGRKLLELEEIDVAFCAREICWSKVLLLVSVVAPEHEAAWLERARALTVRELRLEVRRVRPGQAPRRPGDTKGLPEIRFRHDVTVSTLTHQKIELAKQKLAAELEHPVGDAELLDVLSGMFLELEQDGSVPGRKRVPASLFRIVLRPGAHEDELVLDGEDGPVPILDTLGDVRAIRCDAQRMHAHDDAGAPGAENHEERDRDTPEWMRALVLTRDGQRCRLCRSRWDLMAHHVEFLSHGGRTRPGNLVTLCTTCHGLVHTSLVTIEGDDVMHLRFLDAKGREVHRPRDVVPRPPPLVRDVAAATPAPAGTRASTSEAAPDALDRVPAEIDGAWWRRNAARLSVTPRGLMLAEGPEASEPCSEPTPASPSEATFDRLAFARSLDGLVGQDDLRARLEKVALGRHARGKPFPHTILLGPPGTGKSTIAQALATSLGRRLHRAAGPTLTDVPQLVRLLACIETGDVVFIDEVHACPQVVLEALYEAVTERRLSLVLHAGARARAVSLALPVFTLIAATTEEGDLPSPFLSRFGLHEALAPYAPHVLAEIVARRARSEGFTIDPQAARQLGDLGRGTPREALRLLESVLDVTAADRTTVVGSSAAAACVRSMGYDAEGLRPLEQRYMALLRRQRGRLSLRRLSTGLGVPTSTLTRDVEPHLFAHGFIDVSGRGRIALPRAARAEA